ncbi:MAG: hypothetical protein ABSC19_20545 [Syntrophorhabdales bacterium]
MIDLRAVYGNKLFDRKASYGNARYIPLIVSLALDILITLIILKVFDVSWDYAFVKVYGLLMLYELVKYVSRSMVGFLNYRLVVKHGLASEIRHYLSLFKSNVNWGEVGTYDDFLLEAAFSDTLSADLRALAAINYGNVVGAITLDPHFEGRSYKLFCQIAED